MFVRFLIIICGLVFGGAQATLANPICVTAEKANLRSGPGQNFKVTWTVGKFMPLMQVGSKGQWIQVRDLDGEEHWINSSMVSRKVQCVVVKTRYANLRRGPRASAQIAEIQTADRYTPFKKVDREGSWVQVEDDYKSKFWISDSTLWWPVKRSSVRF